MKESELSKAFARILELEKSLPPRFKELMLKSMQRQRSRRVSSLQHHLDLER